MLTAAGIGLYACSPAGQSSGSTVTVDTVAGVEVVTNTPGRTDRPVGWTVDTEGALLLGSLDGPEETRFGRLTGVTITRSGRILVADGHALTVRVFGRDGAYLFSMGREGDGPGEFRSIDGVAHDPRGETSYVRDPILNRISLFDAEGGYQRSWQLSRPFAQLNRRTSLWVDGQQRIFDLTQLGTTMSVDSVGVVSYDSDGTVLDTTLIAATSPHRLLLVGPDGTPVAAALVPFAAFVRAAVAPDGAVFGGTGEAYEVKVFRNGRLVRLMSSVAGARQVPDWATDTLEAVTRGLMEHAPDGHIEGEELPRLQPFYNFLLVDAAGFLWVARDGLDYTPTGRYEIFDPIGHFAGVLELPPMLVDEVGVDYIVGRRVDALDVERVVVLGLSRARALP
jgi:hypothetical protein